MIRVLFVCLGNICRSPLAEAIFMQLLHEKRLDQKIVCDSAGTGGWHVGEPPDPRTQAVARRYGVPIDHRGYQLAPSNFARYDYIIAMDRSNQDNIEALASQTNNAPPKLFLMRDFDDTPDDPDVPDPYWGGEQGFDDMYHLLLRCCHNLINHLIATHSLT